MRQRYDVEWGAAGDNNEEPIPMTKAEYLEALMRATVDFINGPFKDFPDPISEAPTGPTNGHPSELQEANDEFMLALYHHTKDRRDP